MIFRCTKCGHEFATPSGLCPKCKAREIVKVQEGLVKKSVARLACDISVEKKEKISSGYPLFDQLLSGGLVKGFSILISGAPGVGKSTLLSQLITGYTAHHNEIGFFGTSEEEDTDVVARLHRLRLPLDRTIVMADSVGEQFFQEVKSLKAGIAIIDSIQATTFQGHPLRSVQGAAELVLTAHRWAHESQAIAILSCQETKDGDAAGPLALIHYVDCALQIVMTSEFTRYAQVLKNRRGVAPLQQIVEMTERGLHAIAS